MNEEQVQRLLQISRVDEARREVWGILTSEEPCPDGVVLPYDASVQAIERWIARRGNMREMHQPIAAGKAISFEPDPASRCVWIGTKVSRGAEPTWLKIQDGTLGALSVNARATRSHQELKPFQGTQRMFIVFDEYDIVESSYVDAGLDPRSNEAGLIFRAEAFTDILDEGTLESRAPIQRADGSDEGEPTTGDESEDQQDRAGDGPNDDGETQRDQAASQRAGGPHGPFDGHHSHEHSHDGATHTHTHDHDGDGQHAGHDHTPGEAAALQQGTQRREFSTEERKKLADSGAAMPDGSFPIVTVGDLENAVKAYGRSPDAETKAHIQKRAKALGATDKLPADWSASTKEDETSRVTVSLPAGVTPEQFATFWNQILGVSRAAEGDQTDDGEGGDGQPTGEKPAAEHGGEGDTTIGAANENENGTAGGARMAGPGNDTQRDQATSQRDQAASQRASAPATPQREQAQIDKARAIYALVQELMVDEVSEPELDAAGPNCLAEVLCGLECYISGEAWEMLAMATRAETLTKDIDSLKAAVTRLETRSSEVQRMESAEAPEQLTRLEAALQKVDAYLNAPDPRQQRAAVRGTDPFAEEILRLDDVRRTKPDDFEHELRGLLERMQPDDADATVRSLNMARMRQIHAEGGQPVLR